MKVITNLSAKKNLSFQKQDTTCLWKHIQYCLALTILKDFIKIDFNAGNELIWTKYSWYKDFFYNASTHSNVVMLKSPVL